MGCHGAAAKRASDDPAATRAAAARRSGSRAMRDTASAIHGVWMGATSCATFPRKSRARRSGGAAHTRCERTAAIAASADGRSAFDATTSIGHTIESPAAASRTDVRSADSVTSRARTPPGVRSRPASVVRVPGNAPVRSKRTPMPAGIPAMSADVIDPIGSDDETTISRRAGGAASSQRIARRMPSGSDSVSNVLSLACPPRAPSRGKARAPSSTTTARTIRRSHA